MPVPNQSSDQWWVNDHSPENPFGKSEDYEAFLNYLGDLDRSLTADLAAGPLRINVTDLNDHPAYKEAAIGALAAWSSVTPLEFEVVDDAPFNEASDWMEVVSPDLGEPDDGSAYSADRYVSIGQRFTTPSPTSPGSAAMSSTPSSTNSATSSA
jgi:hypothetical protein